MGEPTDTEYRMDEADRYPYRIRRHNAHNVGVFYIMKMTRKMKIAIIQLQKEPYLFIHYPPDLIPSMCSRIKFSSTIWPNLQIQEIEFIAKLRRMMRE